MKKLPQKLIALALALFVGLAANYVLAAWGNPGVTPPGGNKQVVLNTATANQRKGCDGSPAGSLLDICGPLAATNVLVANSAVVSGNAYVNSLTGPGNVCTDASHHLITCSGPTDLCPDVPGIQSDIGQCINENDGDNFVIKDYTTTASVMDIRIYSSGAYFYILSQGSLPVGPSQVVKGTHGAVSDRYTVNINGDTTGLTLRLYKGTAQLACSASLSSGYNIYPSSSISFTGTDRMEFVLSTVGC